MKIFWLALGALALAGAGCAAKKTAGHFGTGENFPTFSGPVDFDRVADIAWFKKLDGRPVDTSWITPRFREKICLTVTINNHCGGG